MQIALVLSAEMHKIPRLAVLDEWGYHAAKALWGIEEDKMSKRDESPTSLTSLPEEQQAHFETITDDRIEEELEKGRRARGAAQATAHSVVLPARVLLR